MFKDKHIFLTTGPSIFSEEIKSMVESEAGLNGIPVYVNNNGDVALEYLAEQADALILAGGSDIFPPTLGQSVLKNVGLSKFDIRRDKREIKLIDLFKEQNKPILAICRGFQLVCATHGFHLMQNLWGDICHSPGEIKIDLEAGEACHEVTCMPQYRETYFDTLWTNSYHHQGVLIGKELVHPKKNILSRNDINVVGWSDISTDSENNYKIAEIIESEQYKIVGCQFHCEADWQYGNQASLAVINRFKELL